RRGRWEVGVLASRGIWLTGGAISPIRGDSGGLSRICGDLHAAGPGRGRADQPLNTSRVFPRRPGSEGVTLPTPSGSRAAAGYAYPMAKRTPQTMKPATAAKKLGVYLEATPEEFRAGPISRDQLDAWQENPPEWLTDLRRNGPPPRQVVAARLRVRRSGLARGGITDRPTSEEINALSAQKPDWLVAEQRSFEQVRKEEQRIAAQRKEQARRDKKERDR